MMMFVLYKMEAMKRYYIKQNFEEKDPCALSQLDIVFQERYLFTIYSELILCI